MKVEELRKGNFVWDFNVIHPTEKIVSVETIELKGCLLRNERGVYRVRYQFLKPIPLTPEWLERFGFELDREQECYIICVDEDWCYLLIDMNDMSAAIQSTTEEKTGSAVCLHLPLTQYVHQIQNLFYSLSGEELTYNP